jgi:hypothetical protein
MKLKPERSRRPIQVHKTASLCVPTGAQHRAANMKETQMIREAITWALMSAFAIGLIMVGFNL